MLCCNWGISTMGVAYETTPCKFSKLKFKTTMDMPRNIQTKIPFKKTKVIVKEEKREIRQDEENKESDRSSSSRPSAVDDVTKQILKEFDLTTKYGPCLGITRLSRWERAKDLNLNPPNEVYTILKLNQSDPEYTECLWRNEIGLVP